MSVTRERDTATIDKAIAIHSHLRKSKKTVPAHLLPHLYVLRKVDARQMNNTTSEVMPAPKKKITQRQFVQALAGLDIPPPVKKLEPRQPWGCMPRVFGKIDADARRPEPLPVPTTFSPRQPLKFERDKTPLTGHQQAARKAGLDVNHPGIEAMTFDQMKGIADQKQIAVAREQAERMGIAFGSRGETYHRR